MAREIKSGRAPRLRIVSGRIAVASGTPSASAGNRFSVTDTAAGKVTITLTEPGRTLISAVANAIEATDTLCHSVKILAQSASAVTFGIFAHDGTDGVLADDVGFSFMIVVADA